MDTITIHPPFFLAESRENCWKCSESCVVYGFIATDITDDEGRAAFEGPYFLQNIEELPNPLACALPQRTESFRKVASRTAGFAYYANICKCGANFGDHYLFSEPGGAFFPLYPDDLAKIKVVRVESSETLQASAGYGTVPDGIGL